MIADVEYAHHEVAGPELNGTQLIRQRNQHFISLTISAYAILGFAHSWFALFLTLPQSQPSTTHLNMFLLCQWNHREQRNHGFTPVPLHHSWW